MAAVQELGLACQYARAATRLPDLLREAHAHLRGPDRLVALRIVAAASRWAAVTLKCLDHPSDAWIASERSLDAAKELGDPVVIGVAQWSRGHTANAAGAYARAVAVAMAGLEALRDCDAPQATEVRGALHLLAGWAELALGHAVDGTTLIDTAADLAQEVGDQVPDPFGLIFCPTNVGLWRISAAVETGDSGRAVEISTRLTPGILPTSRQAALYLDLGRALADVGQVDRAVRAIVQAERVGRERVHQSALARETVRALLDQARRVERPALGAPWCECARSDTGEGISEDPTGTFRCAATKGVRWIMSSLPRAG